MLSDQEAEAMEGWVFAARRWSEASDEFVGAAGGLALISRTLADHLHGDGVALSPALAPGAKRERGVLAEELELLANTIEDESARARNGLLETAARLQLYNELLD